MLSVPRMRTARVCQGLKEEIERLKQLLAERVGDPDL